MTICKKCSKQYEVNQLSFDSGFCKDCSMYFWELPFKSSPDDEWPFRLLLVLLFVVLLGQMIVLPCLCRMGALKLEAGLYLDAFILVRIIIAKILHTKGKGWLTYVIMLLASFVVIPLVFH
ncbi:MAG: hypothetical protein ACYTFY_11940 [Planctomycetota bacterium]|jgi:hypothetical protein